MKNAIRWIHAPRMPAIVALVIVICVAQLTVSAMAPPSAESLVDAAVKTAKSQDKVVLVHFGASWCVWCRHLDDMFQGPELGKLFADHFVIVHLTVQESDDKKQLENPGAEQLLAREGAGKSGVPVFMFFDQAGRKIADSLALPNRANIGYPASPEEIQAFGGLLEKTTPRMTAAQRASIIDYLKKNAPAPEPAR